MNGDSPNMYKAVIADGYSPVSTRRGRVEIHEKHGSNEKVANTETAKYLADKHGYKIKLLPDWKINGRSVPDSFNETLGTFQEYKHCTTATKSAIDNELRKGNKQARSVVIRISSDISLENLRDGLSDRIRRTRLKSVTLIRNGKDVTYFRQKILGPGFKIKQSDFK